MTDTAPEPNDDIEPDQVPDDDHTDTADGETEFADGEVPGPNP